MKPTIALVMPVCNDLRWLRVTLPYEMQWADQVCLLDMGSTDGTKEFCRLFLRPHDRYMRREENTCPELGFSEANNCVASMALTDWICFGAADQVLIAEPEFMGKLLEGTKQDAISLERLNIQGGFEPEQWERQYRQENRATKSERHVNIVRRGVGISAKGYIHEELFQGERNCAEIASIAKHVNILHFQGGSTPELRQMRYSWMLHRASQDKELQAYTNKWWYDTYCKEHAADLATWAAKYEAYVKDTGQK
jgi:hypothetical protein